MTSRVGARLFLRSGVVIEAMSWTVDLADGLVVLDRLSILGEYKRGCAGYVSGLCCFDRGLDAMVHAVDVIAGEVVRCRAHPTALERLAGNRHSLKRHPLMSEPDFWQIAGDVQFGRTSWPVGLVFGEPIQTGFGPSSFHR